MHTDQGANAAIQHNSGGQMQRLFLLTVALLASFAATTGAALAGSATSVEQWKAEFAKDGTELVKWRAGWDKRQELISRSGQLAMQIAKTAAATSNGQISRDAAKDQVRSHSAAIQQLLAQFEKTNSRATVPDLATERFRTLVRNAESNLLTFVGQVRWLHQQSLSSFEAALSGDEDAYRFLLAQQIDGVAVFIDIGTEALTLEAERTRPDNPQAALYKSIAHSSSALTVVMRHLSDVLRDPKIERKIESASFQQNLDSASHWIDQGRRFMGEALNRVASDASLSPEASVVLQLFFETYEGSFVIEEQFVSHLSEVGVRFEELTINGPGQLIDTLKQFHKAREEGDNNRRIHLRSFPAVLQKEYGVTP